MNDSESRRVADTERAGRNGLMIFLPTSVAVVAALSVVALVVLFGFLLARSQRHSAPPSGAAHAAGRSTNSFAATPDDSAFRRGQAGPWGELEYVKITLERPDEFIKTHYSTNHLARWFFENYTSEQLLQLFGGTDLTPEQRSVLSNTAHWQVQTNGIFVVPGADLILSLSRPARTRIYSVLAESELNTAQYQPYSFDASEVNGWFYQNGLSEETLQLVNSLLYQRGSSLCFSDMAEIMPRVKSETERRRLLKTLSRQSSVLMKLRIRPGTDVEKLVAYWAKGGRAKDIRPLLESLTRVPGGTSIDVAHLLPRFARTHLYTFPYPSSDPIVAKRNCFWTALNFFNETPDDRLCDYKFTEKVIQEEYYPIQDEPTFGDVIFLLDAREAVVHAAVYLADDMVFTKNGRSFTEPWRVMSVKEMLSEYPSNTPLRPIVYRWKKL